jgi:hypothetical protein
MTSRRELIQLPTMGTVLVRKTGQYRATVLS